ncbi:hypothetical protein CMO86_04875 [Candidatus Woesearchaeota archaeon]|nr:hypothetical protein [Candidatus Woesearchaeota archaeon]|tara:strand:- start:581 stop:1528 length:948 start_codon:yes stop_codon:yes gene_type:complete
MTNLTIKGNFNEHYIKATILDIYLKWKIPDNIEEILIIDDKKHFSTISKRIPQKFRKEFKETYMNDPTSLSITAGDFDLIIISITQPNEQYLKKNKKALEGLIAHELMHVELRRMGFDYDVEKLADNALKNFIKSNFKRGEKKEYYNIFNEIKNQCTYVIKDIITNLNLIDVGMGDEMFEDYYNYYINQKTLKTANLNINSVKNSNICSNLSKKKCNEIYKKQLGIDVGTSILFELSLLPVIIPYGKEWINKGTRKYKKLINFIGDNYEILVRDIAEDMDKLIKMSFNSKFDKKYFQHFYDYIFKIAYKRIVLDQ